MGLKDRLKSRAVEVISKPRVGPPPLVGEDISLFDAVMGEQRPTRRDGVRIIHGEDAISAHLENLTEAQRAGYAAEAELARQRQVRDA